MKDLDNSNIIIKEIITYEINPEDIYQDIIERFNRKFTKMNIYDSITSNISELGYYVDSKFDITYDIIDKIQNYSLNKSYVNSSKSDI